MVLYPQLIIEMELWDFPRSFKKLKRYRESVASWCFSKQADNNMIKLSQIDFDL